MDKLLDPVKLTLMVPRQLRTDLHAAAAANGQQSGASWIRMVLANACKAAALRETSRQIDHEFFPNRHTESAVR